MMDDRFKRLVNELSITPLSIDIFQKIILLIEQHTHESFSSFVSQSIQPLFALKYWAWQRLNQGSHEWINRPNCIHSFRKLASFNKSLIFNDDDIDNETKASLLIPETVDQINNIFKQIENSNDDNDPFIFVVNLWFDNLSFFIRESPQFNTSPVICYITQYIGRNYLMTDQFKFYLTQLQQSQRLEQNFSSKKLFYIKICPFFLSSYLSASVENCPLIGEEILHHIGNEYLQIINIHSHTIEIWNEELLGCIAHLTDFIRSCCWWGGEKSTQIKILFPTEQILCDFAQALMRMVSYERFYKEIKPKRFNSETILIDTILKFMMVLLHTQNINWLFRSNLTLADTLLIIAENSTFDEICLHAYGILGEALTDERLKELKISDNIANIFHNTFIECWNHPLKKYKQLTILDLLRDFLYLAKSDAIQQTLAKSHSLSLLTEICDQYPIAFDILWALSFNHDIQQKLRSDAKFMSKLSYLAKECDNEQMRNSTHGLLWNLEINHGDHPPAEINDQDTFDIMISYSHKDKTLCQQIYKELTKVGYHVWIDFDQMHGNVMDAMAQAIERSQTVIICMSEEYQKSNYCRAEAHYAFQRQRKIVPVLLQKHYKPDGWLLFLIGQLLYVDFIKHEFDRAMQMLLKELKDKDVVETNPVVVQPKQNTIDTSLKLYLPPILPKNMLNWTPTHVQEWLTGHNLNQMSRLLANFNGRSLLHLDGYIRNCDTNQILNLLEEDSFKKTGQTLSLTELSCFRSLMESNMSTWSTKADSNISKKSSFVCCRMM